MSKNDDIGPSKGLKALVNKTVMFILYPLRKPKSFIILMLVLAAIIGVVFGVPVYYGAKPEEVHKWYIEKYKSFDMANIAEIVKPKVEEKGIDMLVELPQDVQPQPSRRQGFGRATGNSTQTVDILASQADDVVSIDTIERFEPIIIAATTVTDTNSLNFPANVKATTDSEGFVSITKESTEASLNYLNEQKEIVGEARVLNANEMVIDNTYIFLHGIYSNPRNQRGVKAGVFLKSALKGETVRCEIIAYTDENAATAECYVGNVSINRIMVEKGYSDKVSLK